jgi:hypothetical protein
MPVVVLGTLALAGYVTVRRALDSTIDEADVEPAIDVTVIESAVAEHGLRAVTDTETLDAAINNEELDRELDVQRLQTAVEENIPTVERAVNADDIESILAHEFDAATDRGLSALIEQEVVEGTIEDGEIGVTADLDELRSVLEGGTAALERTTAAVAEKIGSGTDASMLDAGDESTGESRRIAVVDEQGGLESLLVDNEHGTVVDSHPQSIDIEEPDDRTDDSDPVDGDGTNGPSRED